MFNGLEWFVGAFVIAVLWTAYLTIVADIKFIFRFIAIPAWLVFTISLLIVIDGVFGFAYPDLPPKSQVISYRIVGIKNPQEATIEAWMYITDSERTRLYIFPYTAEREQVLKESLKGRKRGRMSEIDMEDEDNMLKYDIRHKGLPPKLNEQQKSMQRSPQETDTSDKYMMTLPNGSSIEVKPGSTVTVGADGEISISTPRVPESLPGNLYQGMGEGDRGH